jgi:hypothetical protein
MDRYEITRDGAWRKVELGLNVGAVSLTLAAGVLYPSAGLEHLRHGHMLAPIVAIAPPLSLNVASQPG